MNSFILINHETGESFKEYSIPHIEEQIKKEMEKGADLENLMLYKAQKVEIREEEIKKYNYRVICKS